MQYDENGYPMKSGSNVSSNYGATPSNTTATASSSAAYAGPPNQNNNTNQQQYQQRQEGPRYDEHGYPIKPQPTLPQQQQQQTNQQDAGPRYDERGYPIKGNPHQQQTQANNNAQPAYAQQGGAYTSTNNNFAGQNQSQSPYNLQPYGNQLPQHNYWTTGLCDMFADCDVCMEGCCCPFCQEGRIYEAAANDVPNTMNVLACCACWLCFWCPMMDLFNRRKVIEKYNIQDESCCTSLCFSCFCPCVSVCQMQRELQARGMYPGGQCCAPSRDPNSTIGQHAPMGNRNSYQQSI